MNFNDFCLDSKKIDQQTVELNNSVLIDFYNSTGKKFKIEPEDIVKFITCFYTNYDDFYQSWLNAPKKRKKEDDDDGARDDENYHITQYNEGGYRAIFKTAADDFKIEAFATNGGSQTKALTMIINKVICYATGFDYVSVSKKSYFDRDSLEKACRSLEKKKFYDEERLPSSLKESSHLKSHFETWLRNQGKSDRSVTSYADTSMNIANSDLSFFLGLSFSFYNQSSLASIKLNADILQNVPEWQERNKTGKGMYAAGLNNFLKFAEEYFNEEHSNNVPLPKPFILLAGISGTGKSRFVRKQAQASDPSENNYCHVAVRPDWHEPSDLLGYISRIGTEGTRYITTDVLTFIAKAWIEATDSTDTEHKIIPKDNITPYWLCLDEMNLAPVEQYFADFLSILETREWKGGEYSCKPLMKPEVITGLEAAAQTDLRKNLGMEDTRHNPLWQSFLEHGIGIPPNLIVAGTVNMDETTHGFSRKVIDRALTLDFGEFFPNDFDLFFNGQPTHKTLTWSRLTQASPDDLENVPADKGGTKSIAFLKQVNGALKDTPFELAYRALNELLLSVACFSPKDDDELKAVWDDFLMTKVLPRIEGDGDKLQEDGDGNNLLIELKVLLEGADCFNGLQNRPDFLRESADKNTPLLPPLRSLIKISRMNERLNSQGFTAFWP